MLRMLRWTSSFTAGIGIGLIMGTGIEPGATMDHGVTSRAAECPIRYEIYPLVFVTLLGIVIEFSTWTSRRIGERGSGKSTGIDTIMRMGDTRCERPAMIVGNGKGTKAGTGMEGKEDTTVRRPHQVHIRTVLCT